jgi:hypothetical protein
MSCFSPLQGWRSRTPNSSGKFGIVFDIKLANRFKPEVLSVPCGQCVGCRLERSRQWAIRCVHEASLHESNAFITLTFSDKYLPKDRSLDVRVFQRFMKRLRKAIGVPIRFYHCGEYGSKLGRPHYHAIIFGYGFPDKTVWQNRNGRDLFRSKLLEKCWKYGHSSVGSVTFESAAYVARYIMKKINGDAALDHYMDIDQDTGEVFMVKPEYTTMSRRPGIGKNWFLEYSSDVFPSDEVVMRGKKMRPPKYYDSLFEVLDPNEFVDIKKRRVKNAKKHSADQTPARLRVREQ